MSIEDIICTATEAKRLGFCISGCRKMAKKHGIDFKKFIKVGISTSELRSLNEPMADKLADLIEEEHAKNKDI